MYHHFLILWSCDFQNFLGSFQSERGGPLTFYLVLEKFTFPLASFFQFLQISCFDQGFRETAFEKG